MRKPLKTTDTATAARPVAVGTAEHLFVDDQFTKEAPGLALTMHPPAKTGQNILMEYLGGPHGRT